MQPFSIQEGAVHDYERTTAGIIFVCTPSTWRQWSMESIVWFPGLKKIIGGGVPFVMITWLDGKDVRSHIENPDEVCTTEEEASTSALRLHATG
jgi:hypothetical protein